MVPIYTLIWKASSTSPLLTMRLAGYHHLSLLPMEWVVYTEHGKEKRFHSAFGMVLGMASSVSEAVKLRKRL